MGLEQVQTGQGDGGWAPQACTLPTDERPLRMDEFDALLAEAVTGVERVGPGRVKMTLRPEPSIAGRVAELAARETNCCSFFTFTLTATGDGDGDGLALDVTVPDVHATVLDALTARATRTAASGGVRRRGGRDGRDGAA